ncbi:VCBS repeat-containing protein [Clostridium sp. DL1XJH146]
MLLYQNDLWRFDLDDNEIILDFKYGDVTGDGIYDNVYLVGEKNFGEGSNFTENINLVIINGADYTLTSIPFKSNAGYDPRLFLGQFTGSGVDEILISIFSGGSGGMSFYYIFSFIDGKVRKIFDYEKFDDEYNYNVIYQNCYKVEVANGTIDKKYIIDIKYKGKEYLDEIYDKDGMLKKPLNGYVVPISGLYPVDYNGDEIHELLTYRRIIGKYNADSLGIINNALQWTDDKFSSFFEQVSIYGIEF